MKKLNTEKNLINDPLLIETLKRNPFSVPEGYFSALQETILFKKSIAELGESSFVVPADYQNALRQDILSKVSEQRLKERVPRISPSIPDGYFNDLQQRILSKTAGDGGVNPKIIATPDQDSFLRKPIKQHAIRRWIPYAAAASILIVMGVFAVFNNTKMPSSEQTIGYSAQIESVSSDEIIHYLASYTEPGDLQLLSEQLKDRTGDIADDLSAQEIEAYLEYSL